MSEFVCHGKILEKRQIIPRFYLTNFEYSKILYYGNIIGKTTIFPCYGLWLKIHCVWKIYFSQFTENKREYPCLSHWWIWRDFICACINAAWKEFVSWVFLVRIFLLSDWIRTLWIRTFYIVKGALKSLQTSKQGVTKRNI